MPRATTHCSAPVDDKSGAGGLLPGEIPGILCAHCEPIASCPVDFICRFPLVILQQAAQSFSTPHCSRVPSCLRLRRKQDPIALAHVPTLAPTRTLYMTQVIEKYGAP